MPAARGTSLSAASRLHLEARILNARALYLTSSLRNSRSELERQVLLEHILNTRPQIAQLESSASELGIQFRRVFHYIGRASHAEIASSTLPRTLPTRHLQTNYGEVIVPTIRAQDMHAFFTNFADTMDSLLSNGECYNTRGAVTEQGLRKEYNDSMEGCGVFKLPSYSQQLQTHSSAVSRTLPVRKSKPLALCSGHREMGRTNSKRNDLDFVYNPPLSYQTLREATGRRDSVLSHDSFIQSRMLPANKDDIAPAEYVNKLSSRFVVDPRNKLSVRTAEQSGLLQQNLDLELEDSPQRRKSMLESRKPLTRTIKAARSTPLFHITETAEYEPEVSSISLNTSVKNDAPRTQSHADGFQAPLEVQEQLKNAKERMIAAMQKYWARDENNDGASPLVSSEAQSFNTPLYRTILAHVERHRSQNDPSITNTALRPATNIVLRGTAEEAIWHRDRPVLSRTHSEKNAQYFDGSCTASFGSVPDYDALEKVLKELMQISWHDDVSSTKSIHENVEQIDVGRWESADSVDWSSACSWPSAMSDDDDDDNDDDVLENEISRYEALQHEEEIEWANTLQDELESYRVRPGIECDVAQAPNTESPKGTEHSMRCGGLRGGTSDSFLGNRSLRIAFREHADSTYTGLHYSDQMGPFGWNFINSRGNEYFCDIDEEYLTDRFNLTGLNAEVQYYQYALDLITDVFDLECEDDMRDQIEKSARHLYGMVHARYIVTTRGQQKMMEKYKNGDFGKCPRVFCESQNLLPMGQHDVANASAVKLYCSRCEDVYNPKSSRHAAIDGAYFGASFPNFFFQVYPHLQAPKSQRRYEPRIYGFRVYASAALARWQEQRRESLKERLKVEGINNGFEAEDRIDDREGSELDDEGQDGIDDMFEGRRVASVGRR